MVVDAVIPLTGSPVQLVSVPDDGVPSTGVVSVGLVKVLLVNVSVVALPTSVSVLVGNVNVPVLDMVAITGAVKVLLVSVCERDRVTTSTPSMVTTPAADLAMVVSLA